MSTDDNFLQRISPNGSEHAPSQPLTSETSEPNPQGQMHQGRTAPVLGRLSLALVFAVASLWVFFWVAHELTETETLRTDRAVLAFFQSHQYPPFHAVMRAVSSLAGSISQSVVVIAALGYFAVKKRFNPDGISLLLAGVGGAGVITALKLLFHRARPDAVFAHLGYSFPSGHSFFALVVYGMLAYLMARHLPRHRKVWVWALAITAILLVGFSRVFLGEHFPSDVAAGFAVAVPWLWGCLALPNAFHHRHRDVPGHKAQLLKVRRYPG